MQVYSHRCCRRYFVAQVLTHSAILIAPRRDHLLRIPSARARSLFYPFRRLVLSCSLFSRLIVIDCASFWYVPTNTTTWRHLTTGVGQHLPAQTFVPSWCNPGQDPDPAWAISATRCLCALLSLIWFSFSGPVGEFIPHLPVFCSTFSWSFLVLRPLSIHISLIYSSYSRCCHCR